MVCLGNQQRLFCHFWDCIQVLNFRPFCWVLWLLHFFKGFLPTIVNMMVIWVKFTHSSHFSSLIPKMLMFNLSISCLATTNSLWLMDMNQVSNGSWTWFIPVSYAIFFPTSAFTSITSYTNNWALFFLWLHLLILSRVVWAQHIAVYQRILVSHQPL